MNKTKTKYRIFFSSMALLTAVSSIVFRSLLYKSTPGTFGFRYVTVQGLFSFAPIAAMFVFSIIEPKLKNINKRMLFVESIFVMVFLQFIFQVVFLTRGSFRSFALSLCSPNAAFYAIPVSWTIMTVLVPFVKNAKKLIRFYSIAALLFIVSASVICAVTDNMYINNLFADIAIPLCADIFFYLVLFSFGDLCNSNNALDLKGRFIDGFLSDFSDYLFYKEDDDQEKDDDESNSDKSDDEDTSLCTEYKKIMFYMMYEQNTDFLKIHEFFEKISKDIFAENGSYFAVEEYIENVKILSKIVDEINEKCPGYLSDLFPIVINEVLNKNEDEFSIVLDTITIAKIILNNHIDFQPWHSAARKFNDIRRKSKTGE